MKRSYTPLICKPHEIPNKYYENHQKSRDQKNFTMVDFSYEKEFYWWGGARDIITP